jgi:electron transfer flavoprotein beta subunit
VADHLQMPSLTQVIKIDVEDGKLRCERQAEYGYDTVLVELPAVISGRRRDQRAALPVAEGDHGRQEEAAGDKAAGDDGHRGRPRRATTTLAPTAPTSSAAGQVGRQIIEDEDTNETVEKIVAWLDERKLLA